MRYERYARKRKTGALWGYIRPGVWIKLSCGSKHINTKPVGYYGFNFFPAKRPGRWIIEDHTNAQQQACIPCEDQFCPPGGGPSDLQD